MAAIEYLTVDHLNTKDLIRIFNKICIHPDLQHDGTPCWIWTNSRQAVGYGQTCYHGKRPIKVHRLTFAWLIHPLPHGRKHGELDHLCKRTSCCNPLHLEFTDSRTNILRGNGQSAKNAKKTHCLRGHLLVRENIYLNGKNKTSRQCRICILERMQAQRDAAKSISPFP